MAQAALQRFLREGGLDEPPPTLNDYVRFVDSTLTRWKEQGAVGVKFDDAYYRTLLFEDVSEEEARPLYQKGLGAPLAREQYLALQDYLCRHIFLEAGRLDLSVHIHSGHGVPPFLQAREADVRNLEPVLTDVRFFETQFVLIHGGEPLYEDAAYLALKPHVWLDISAIPFLCEVSKLADALRIYLRYAPEKVLFGTDVAAYPGVPVGPEVQHELCAGAFSITRNTTWVGRSRRTWHASSRSTCPSLWLRERCQNSDRSRGLVLVNESAQHVPASHGHRPSAELVGRLARLGRSEVEPTMRPPPLVVLDVGNGGSARDAFGQARASGPGTGQRPRLGFRGRSQKPAPPEIPGQDPNPSFRTPHPLRAGIVTRGASRGKAHQEGGPSHSAVHALTRRACPADTLLRSRRRLHGPRGREGEAAWA